ncbi:MAG: septum site-determining protein MinC [Peptostreptococcaceae bacterium]|nr:septum site-determining protein MinC [Peptostreptococcaceae bacterium]
MRTEKKSIEFRATRNGPVIRLREGLDREIMEEEIERLFQENGDFFEGSDLLNLSLPEMDGAERNELLRSLESKLPIRFNLVWPEEKREVPKREKRPEETIREPKISSNEGYRISKFIKNTVRSGLEISFDGNIIILGDVNPGAQIIASGNIIVMGSLRGVAHAGSKGDKSAFVVANRFEPIQLRIAEMIAISPEEDPGENQGPQVAYISEGSIMIETCLTRA